ncbi:uncharacterized protein At5g39865 [Cicer arietinum]|uniref:Uncharacterized protein At5g39865 n=1 Tax=Cicer arietinum TaxID=3827 RepID=A0A1S2XK01_CICAR|nr:uncharacterized protein At5g39865 [Cicer arietinum]
MGCVSSKQKECMHCNGNNSYCPVSRSYTMHVHHPPQTKGDSYHVVALTSTTLGSLEIVSHNNHANDFMFSNVKVSEKKDIEENTWSNMIDEKLPKAIVKESSITTPPCELENDTIINTWELMEGLEDVSPFQSPNNFKSFSFDANVNEHVDPTLKTSFFMVSDDGIDSHKPRLDLMFEEGKVSDFDDSKVVSSFKIKKSLEDKQEGNDRKRFSFEEKKISDVVDFKIDPYGKKEKVVLYFTSLRGVRKTYEDCCNVRMILKGLGIMVDERDVSMHLRFKEELKELLGEGYGKGGLPKVFVGKKFIGGVEEIMKLHEDGKLEKLLDWCERIDDIEGGDGECDVCGDIKFVPCETCYGSCKIYYDDDDDEVGECGFQRCPNCNENGLIRCPMCCF